MASSAAISLRKGTGEDEPHLAGITAHSPEASTWVSDFDSLIAEQQGAIAGFVIYRVVLGEGELFNLAVHPAHRRQGVATVLVQALQRLAPVWHLEVRQSNQGAIAFYATQGFQQVGRRERYYSDGETALLLKWQTPQKST
ncbi:GNAT family N-acetyltransferase [Bryobacter aggregatus]|uniref:GNAT family N-acetyltransferase n=1 Tax=Bryobacter aggregatus TaxID=360054 RepID=UPI00068A6DE3|nr:GNAT family N-acetyltransferase [Bryobacter aggregatus]